MTQDHNIATHTQGPWHVAPDGFRVTDKKTWFDEDGARNGETPNIVIFCETKPNARLVAAAPDMLEALRMVHWLDQGFTDDGGAMPSASTAMDAVAKAIAKAEGRA